MEVKIELSIDYPSVVSSTKVKWMPILHAFAQVKACLL